MDVEQTTIPAMDEVTLTGMTKHLAPRILECSKGGYVVVFDGHGISAVTSFGEAIEKIMEVGSGVFGVEFEPDVPNIARPPVMDPPEPLPAGFKEINVKRMLHVFMATIATCLIAIGIKIT